MTEFETRAVLFDMDGTLVDSTAVVESVWSRFADMLGVPLAEILATSHGVRMEDTVRRHASANADVDAIVEELSGCELASTEPVVAVPGAAAFVRSLPADAVALVTSATLDLAELRMRAITVPMPGVVVTASDVDRGKPFPDCYLRALALIGEDPADAVVFEDAPAGIEAALAAGIRTVVVGGYDGPLARGLMRVPDYRNVRVVSGAGPGRRVRIRL